MSEESVEVVRAALDAWNEADMDRFRDLWDSDGVARPAAGWPEPGPFVGREAVMRSFEQLREAWEADTLDAVEFTDLADRVVVRMVWRGVGHGPDLAMQVSNVFTVRDGKISRLESFWDHAEALKAARLQE